MSEEQQCDKHDANDIERECMEEAAALVMCGAVRQGAARQVAQSMRGLIEQFAVARSAVSSTREKPQEPVGTGTMFHWRDYIFFGLKDDGTVRIKQYANNIPPASPPWADEPEHQIGMVFDISIPAAEWQSILGFTAPGLIKDRKSIVAMTGLLAQARRERDTALSAIVPKWLVRAGGDNYETWLCPTRDAVRNAFCEALYGDVASADAEDIDGYMKDLDQRIVEDKDVRWSFEDGWLEVIELNGRADDRAVTPCSCGATVGQYHATGCGYEGVFNG